MNPDRNFASLLNKSNSVQGLSQFYFSHSKLPPGTGGGVHDVWPPVFGQLVVHCPGGESAVHLLKAGLQSSMGGMGLARAPPDVHQDDTAVSNVA